MRLLREMPVALRDIVARLAAATQSPVIGGAALAGYRGEAGEEFGLLPYL
jgi:hypothetical protein